MPEWKDFIEKKARMTDGSHPSVLENDPAYGLYGKPATPADAEAMAQNANAMARQKSEGKIQDPIDQKGMYDAARGIAGTVASVWNGMRGEAYNLAKHGYGMLTKNDQENVYKRGKLFRGIGKGVLESPATIPGILAGVGSGIGAVAIGKPFGEGWDHGIARWDELAANPWHRFVSWATTPVRNVYDKGLSKSVEEVRRASGDYAAEKLIDEGSELEGKGEFLGPLIGLGPASRAFSAGRGILANSRAAKAVMKIPAKARKAVNVTGKAALGTGMAYPMYRGAKDTYYGVKNRNIIEDSKTKGQEIRPEDIAEAMRRMGVLQ